MKAGTDEYERREQFIAGLLWYGTWIASIIIAAGMALSAFEQFDSFPFSFSGYAIVKAGIALFILLPIARVALMLVIFLHDRDYLYTAISMLVLAIIAAGIVFGL